MTDQELHEKAVRLCEGGCVCIQGHFVKTGTISMEVSECDFCEMDSICRSEMVELCVECDAYDGKKHYLYLANKRTKTR